MEEVAGELAPALAFGAAVVAPEIILLAGGVGSHRGPWLSILRRQEVGPPGEWWQYSGPCKSLRRIVRSP